MSKDEAEQSKFTLKDTIGLPMINSAGGLVCNHHDHILLRVQNVSKILVPKVYNVVYSCP